MAKKTDDTALQFGGSIVKLETRAPKVVKPASWEKKKTPQIEGGSVLLTIEVPRPEPPEAPTKPYIARPKEPLGAMPAKPELTQTEGETKSAFAARKKEAERNHTHDVSVWRRREQQHAEWERYDQAMKRHREASARMGQQLAAYAQLAGVGHLLQAVPLEISMRPDGNALRRFLPGFSPAMALLAT